MGVHEVARAGFGTHAEVYERSRPSYPPGAVAWLAEHLGLGPGRTTCDLAAGTGKLTRLLVPIGGNLVAVEPVAGMRRVLVDTLPPVPVVAATAEALPFPAGTFDAVTVAQAFHWFDRERALPELRRVLRRGGRLGLVWNARDRSVGWVDRVWGVVDRVEKRAPWRDHDRWDASPMPGFGPIHAARFDHVQPMSPEGVVARVASVSHVAVLPARAREAVLDEVRGILADDPQTRDATAVAVPYRVDAYWLEPL